MLLSSSCYKVQKFVFYWESVTPTHTLSLSLSLPLPLSKCVWLYVCVFVISIHSQFPVTKHCIPALTYHIQRTLVVKHQDSHFLLVYVWLAPDRNIHPNNLLQKQIYTSCDEAESKKQSYRWWNLMSVSGTDEEQSVLVFKYQNWYLEKYSLMWNWKNV